MLLSTISRDNNDSNDEEIDVEVDDPIPSYLKKISRGKDDPYNNKIDHNYSKFWNRHSESKHSKPAHLLFMDGLFKKGLPSSGNDEVIDVESVTEDVKPVFDNEESRSAIAECDKFLESCSDGKNEEEKEPLNKAGWTATHRNLHKNAMKIIHGNRLSRLSSIGTINEIASRRITVKKGARKMRQLFAANFWDMRLIRWLHGTLVENLSECLLSEYLDILKALSVKIPVLVNKLLSTMDSLHAKSFGISSAEGFKQLLNKPSNTIYQTMIQHKPKKLPGNPYFVIVPSLPTQSPATLSHRKQFWNAQLGALGKVVQIPVHCSANATVEEGISHVLALTRNRISELKTHIPKRGVVLVGWMIGALIASHICLEESVDALICLGFPLQGVTGSRGDLDDPLLDNKVPVLFAIGQNASMCSMDNIEEFRERMSSETNLVVVGGANDLLRVSASKKKADKITQSMVDKCLVTEIEEFLGPVLSPRFSPPSAAASKLPKPAAVTTKPTTIVIRPEVTDESKRLRRRPREYSPEIPPARKRPRTVGRQNAPKLSTASTSTESSSEEEVYRKEKKLKMHKKLSPHKISLSRVKAHSSEHKSKHGNDQRASTSAASTRESNLSSKNAQPDKKPIPQLVNEIPAPPVVKKDPAQMLAEQPKDGPVDVEKAFGKDCSFLPRPFTPTLEYDTTDATDPLGDKSLDAAMSGEALTNTEKSTTIIGTSIAPQSGEPQKIAIVKTLAGFPVSTLTSILNPTITIQKSLSKAMEQTIDINKVDVASAATGKNLTSTHAKLLTSGSLDVKRVHSIMSSLTTKNLAASTSSPARAVLVSSPSSSAKATTFIMSNNDATKLQLQRMLLQGSQKVPVLSKLISSDETKVNLGEQRICNLSLLSDVAVMKEQSQDSPVNTTLVKLSNPPNIKPTIRRYKVMDPATSTTTRYESPEELAEKQMAIQSLNSLDDDNESATSSYMSPPTARFGGRSLGYSSMLPTSLPAFTVRPPYRRGRGRSYNGLLGNRGRGVQFF